MEGELALLVPIMALMIPIVAIVLRSQVGQALAKYLEAKASSSGTPIESLVRTEQLFLDLDNRVRELETTLKQVKEDNSRLQQRLLQGKSFE